MYAVAARLDPDSYLALARAVFAEMALAGITAVGEFHYLHHAPDGRPYADPNAMGQALAQAAARGRHPAHPARHLLPRRRTRRPARSRASQRRFSDGNVEAWAERVAALRATRPAAADRRGHPLGARGAARRRSPVVAEAAAATGPLHVHLSEQPAENDACLAALRLHPDRAARRPRACSARARPPCTPRT